jgi:hypothetical protein
MIGSEKIAVMSDGPAGFFVPGWSGGAMGLVTSAKTLYQCVGISDCGRVKWVVVLLLLTRVASLVGCALGRAL